jgi:GDP-L-fucose synthase
MPERALAGRHVLVTGGAGFLGSHLVEGLRRGGCRVRATVHHRPAVVEDPAITYVAADLERLEDCRRAVAGVDTVVHCAANTSGAAVMVRTPLVHVTPNVVMNTQLLDAAYGAGVTRFVFVSSGAAYPPTGSRPVDEDEMFDGEPYPAYYPVAWMKRYAEVLCEMYARRLTPPMPTVVVRPSNVYGPRDKFDPGTSHVTAALIRRVVERQRPFEVWGTGDDVRDLIYVDDFVEGVLRALACPDDFLAVNVAAGRGWSVREILATLLEVDGFEGADVRFDPSRPSTIPVRLMSTRRARERLGFEARVPLAEGLRRTLAWYRRTRGAAVAGAGPVAAEDGPSRAADHAPQAREGGPARTPDGAARRTAAG